MIIGVPKERKTGERRVAITPEGAASLTSAGHRVLVESLAGMLSGYSDDKFRSAGAVVVPSLEEVWTLAELLVKVKEPAPEEYPFFRKGLAIFSFLHPAAAPQMTDELLKSGITGLDYDLLEDDSGALPILRPMSEIAGKLSIQNGAFGLLAAQGGRGVLLGGTTNVPPARVLIIGAGIAGSSAASVALGMGAEVTVLDIKKEKLDALKAALPKVNAVSSNEDTLLEEIKKADLIVGAVLIPGATAPRVLKKEHLALMKKGAVIVDISIDQGGFAETSRPTTIDNPTFVEQGVVHYCVANMPALVPVTATSALTTETIGWIRTIADEGVDAAIANHLPLRKSLVCKNGKLLNEAVGKSLGIPVGP